MRGLQAGDRLAEEAAARAGVTIRLLSDTEECARASELLGAVWQLPNGRSPAEPNLLRALGHQGGYVAGAFDETGDLLGTAVGFLSSGSPLELHSHVTGIAAAAQGRGLGAALKLHQRSWALDRSIETITWTFDPLLRRNAGFNLVRLRARASEYLLNFYGDMSDGINAGVDSDRLLVRWDLAGDLEAAQLPEGIQVLTVSKGDRPEILDAAGADVVLLDLPADIRGLRRTDPALGAAWRAALRATMHTRLAAGWTIRGFDPATGYVLSA